MALLAYNLTSEPVTLVAGVPSVTLPPSQDPPSRGPAVNVTSKLEGLSSEDYDLLAAQAVDTIQYAWTGEPEYDTYVLIPTSIETGGGTQFVYRPGAEQYPTRVYPTFVAAYDAAVATGSLATIVFDNTYDSLWIEPGAYDLSNIVLSGRGTGCWDCNDQVTVPDGVTFSNMREVRYLSMLYYGTSPCITVENTVYPVKLVGATLTDESGGGWFNVVNSPFILTMEEGSALYDDDGYVINADESSFINILAEGAFTEIGSGAINAACPVTVFATAEVNYDPMQQSLTGGSSLFFQDHSDFIYFDSGHGSWNTGPSDVQSALVELSQRSAAASNTSFDNGQGSWTSSPTNVEAALVELSQRPGPSTFEVFHLTGNNGAGFLSAGDHLKFDAVLAQHPASDSVLIMPDLTSTYTTAPNSPSIGRIPLRGGYIYELVANPGYTDASNLQLQWYNATRGAWLGLPSYGGSAFPLVPNDAKAVLVADWDISTIHFIELQIRYISGSPTRIGDNNPFTAQAIIKVLGRRS